MTVIPDPISMVLLARHDALELLAGAYAKVAVPTSIIEVIESTALDKGISEGWLELLDPDIDHVMRVDEIQSRSGVKLSVHEEACIALALQLRADAVLTIDREVQLAAKLLGLRVDGISWLVMAASKSGRISKEEGIRLFHKICKEIVPGLGIEVAFQNSQQWQRTD